MDAKILYLISKLDESLFTYKNNLDSYFEDNDILFFAYEKTYDSCEFYRLFTCNKRTLEVNYYFLNENFNIKAEIFNKTKSITGALTNIDLRHILSSNNRIMPESLKQRKNEICQYYKIFIEKTILERSLNMRNKPESLISISLDLSDKSSSNVLNLNPLNINKGKNKVVKI